MSTILKLLQVNILIRGNEICHKRSVYYLQMKVCTVICYDFNVTIIISMSYRAIVRNYSYNKETAMPITQ